MQKETCGNKEPSILRWFFIMHELDTGCMIQPAFIMSFGTRLIADNEAFGLHIASEDLIYRRKWQQTWREPGLACWL
jgi:hypothetical protein